MIRSGRAAITASLLGALLIAGAPSIAFGGEDAAGRDRVTVQSADSTSDDFAAQKADDGDKDEGGKSAKNGDKKGGDDRKAAASKKDDGDRKKSAGKKDGDRKQAAEKKNADKKADDRKKADGKKKDRDDGQASARKRHDNGKKEVADKDEWKRKEHKDKHNKNWDHNRDRQRRHRYGWDTHRRYYRYGYYGPGYYDDCGYYGPYYGGSGDDWYYYGPDACRYEYGGYRSAFLVDMSWDQVVPDPGPEGAVGTANLEIDVPAGVVCFRLAYDGIDRAIGAQIHPGRPGEVGPAQVLLHVGQNGDDGCVGADPAILSEIQNDPRGYYLEINDEVYGQAMRGQLDAPDYRGRY